MIIESPLDLIFRNLFYRLRSFAWGHDVFLKLEGFNVSCSIKVKTAIGLIEFSPESLDDVIGRSGMTECLADGGTLGFPLCSLQEFGTGIAPPLGGLDIDIAPAQAVLEPLHHT